MAKQYTNNIANPTRETQDVREKSLAKLQEVSLLNFQNVCCTT